MITLLAILAILSITILLAAESGWNNVLSAQRNELVFLDRNKDYGAYPMRREHHRTVLLAFLIALGFLGGAVALPHLFPGEVAAPPLIPMVTIDDEMLKVVDVALARKADPAPTPPAPKPAGGGAKGIGPIVAVDSIPQHAVDTVPSTPDPDPGPGKGGDPDPDPDPAPDAGGGSGTSGGTDFGVKDGWELEAMPEYPGGDPALYKYLKNEVHYPDIDITARREGRVTVGFIIRSDGSVSDVRILQGVSPTMDAEALRVVRKMIKWKPGRFNKREVDVRYALPIVFKLRN